MNNVKLPHQLVNVNFVLMFQLPPYPWVGGTEKTAKKEEINKRKVL